MAATNVDEAAPSEHSPSAADILLRMPQLTAGQWAATNAVYRWLIMVRAAVLPMTISAALIAMLLALASGPIDILSASLLVIGLVAAHATNNLINDWVDWHQGVDVDNTFRSGYGAHVLQQRLIGKRTYLMVTAATGTVAVATGLGLTALGGVNVFYVMLAGAFFVVFYTWPLKHVGLGEFAVFVVWGPMMIAGGYFVLTGTITLPVIGASFAYGIAPTLVIIGKHIDKASQDARLGIRTLPVLLGDRRARLLSVLLLGCEWGLLAALAMGWPWLWLALASTPAAWKLGNELMHERPRTKPERYPAALWPLWFSAFSFRYARNFGVCMITALALTALTG